MCLRELRSAKRLPGPGRPPRPSQDGPKATQELLGPGQQPPRTTQVGQEGSRAAQGRPRGPLLPTSYFPLPTSHFLQVRAWLLVAHQCFCISAPLRPHPRTPLVVRLTVVNDALFAAAPIGHLQAQSVNQSVSQTINQISISPSVRGHLQAV